MRKSFGSTSDSLIGWNTISRNGAKYMTRFWIGRLRLHVFHSPDLDRHPHDHPWDFWTFPLTSYAEEVFEPDTRTVKVQVVYGWRWHYRSELHSHRVLGRWPHCLDQRWRDNRRIYTIVWRGAFSRRWGFWIRDGNALCWRQSKDYDKPGGDTAPCE